MKKLNTTRRFIDIKMKEHEFYLTVEDIKRYVSLTSLYFKQRRNK